jgi:glycosyltransferase involved in cell wall biosynthesis
VLLVIDTLGVGGAESLLPVLLKSIDPQRFSVSVLTLDTKARNHVRDQVAEHAHDLIEWTRRPLLDPRRVSDISSLIAGRGIDMVHTHLLYSNVQGSLAAHRAGIPCVATLHNVYPAKSLVRSVPKRRVEAFALRMAGASVIAVSDEVAGAYSGPGLLPRSSIVTLPNAIDLDRLMAVTAEDAQRTREEILRGSDGPLIVAVGRMVRQKGYPDLVRAARRLVDRYPEARLVIAGKPSDDTAAVEREIARVNLHDNVMLLGMRPDVPQLLMSADVYVMPSLWEGAPIALLEAMASGTPVVATRVGGIPGVVSDGRNGLLVEPHNPVDLAEAIDALLKDPERAHRLGSAGRQTAQRFGAREWARRIEAQYESALGVDGESACR